MKWLKRLAALPFILLFALFLLFAAYEITGACINHIITHRQTSQMQRVLQAEIPDIKIIQVESQTGNTSGTGNHVDCLSAITFATDLSEAEIVSRLAVYYQFDEWSCYIDQTPEGCFRFYLCTAAPFADNIEGH